MLLLAYFVLVLSVAALIARRDRRPSRLVSRAAPVFRIAAVAAGLAALAGSAWALDALSGESEHALSQEPVAWAIWGALGVGGLLLAVGSARWTGNQALRLRVIGWVLATAALSVPSTLTLALPVAAALIVTLVDFPPRRQALHAGSSVGSPL